MAPLGTATEGSMAVEAAGRALARRKLLLHDSLAFLTLLLMTAILFGLTLLLFRSFTSHRDELARRWAARGTVSMRNGHPEQAIGALRTALNYAPDNRDDELLLAQALGEAGRTEESYNYFMTLWEAQPGSGFINLELARLAAKRYDRNAAVEFYRASIYGTWEGDGVVRRAEVRLELARYLIDARQYDAARMELLIASGNSPETSAFDLSIGTLLTQAKDRADAWSFYEKAVTAAPRDAAVLEAAGRFAYGGGDYENARHMLLRAQAIRNENHLGEDPALETLGKDSTRITELIPDAGLPSRENAQHVLDARKIAKKRLDACTAEHASQTPPPSTLQALAGRWTGPDGSTDAVALRDPEAQDAAMRLIYDTELTTESTCSPATGDDALLLLVAGQARPVALAAPSPVTEAVQP